ncbi:MAG: DinB family protein [Pyrinomonadaceae bacterium]
METAERKHSTIGSALAAELDAESATLLKMIERLPDDKFDWKPHEKSMSVAELANHCVNMADWTDFAINKSELDFAENDGPPKVTNSSAELSAQLKEATKKSVEILRSTPDETLFQDWTLRNGDQVFFTMPKIAVIRTFVLSHIIHHRGQLSVYMRLLDIPVPSIYGPSADEQTM